MPFPDAFSPGLRSAKGPPRPGALRPLSAVLCLDSLRSRFRSRSVALVLSTFAFLLSTFESARAFEWQNSGIWESGIAERAFDSGPSWFSAGPAWMMNAMPGANYRARQYVIDSAGDLQESTTQYNGYVGTLHDAFNVSLFNNIATFGGASGSKTTSPTLAALDPAPAKTFDGGNGSADPATGAGTSWNTATNWVGDAVPGSGDPVLLDNSKLATLPATMQLDAAFTIHSLNLNSANSVNIITNSSGSTGRNFQLNGDGVVTDPLINVTGGGTLTLTSTNGTMSLLLGASGQFNVDTGSTLTINPTIKDNSVTARSVEKTGAGTLTLSGTNTFSGGFTLTNGTFQLGASGGAGTGTLTLAGGTITSNAAGARSPTNVLSITGDTTFGSTGAGAITFSGGGTTTGPRLLTFNTTTTVFSTNALTLGGDLATLGTGGATFSGGIALGGSNRIITGGMTNTLTIGGITGTGNVTLDANSAAAMTINAIVNNTGTVSNSGTNSGTTTISGGIGANVTGINQTSSTSPLTISGGSITLGSNLIVASSGTALTTISGGVTGNFNLTLNANSSGNFSLITNSINNGGTITNSGSSTGTTTIGAVIGSSVTGVTENSATSLLTLQGANTMLSGAVTTLTLGTLQIEDSTTGAAGNINVTKDGFGSGSIALNGGQLNLRANGASSAAAQNVTYGNGTTVGGNTTIDVDRQGGTGTNKTLVLGTLNIGAFTLNVTNAGAHGYGLSFGSTTLTGDAIFNPTTAPVTLGALNDGGTARTITKSGAGSLILGTAATSLVDGTTFDITGGTLNSNIVLALGDMTNVVLSTGATFNVGASQTVGALNSATGGNLGSTTLTANTLTIGNTNNLNSNFAGVISGSGGSIVKSGSGTLTLSGLNTYTGTTTISNGTLSASNVVVSGSASNLGNASSAVVLGGTSTSGTLSYTGGVATYTRGFTVNAGGGNLTNAGTGLLTLNTGSIALNGNLVFSTNANGITDGNSVISGTGSVTMNSSGAGALTINPQNTYEGGTTLQAGTIVLSTSSTVTSGALVSGPLGTGTFHIGSGTNAATLSTDVSSGTPRTIENNISLEGDVTFATTTSSGRIALNTLYSGTGAGASLLTTPNTIVLTRTNQLTVNSNVIVDLTGAISGSGFGITKLGAGTLNIGSTSNTPSNFDSSNNTYTGLTTVSAGTVVLTKTTGTDAIAGNLLIDTTGTVQLNNSDQIKNTSDVTVNSGGTFDLNGKSETINALSGNGTITNTAGSGAIPLTSILTTGGNNGGGTFAGTLQNGGTGKILALTKNGSGTLTLTNTNSYSGTTIINGGTLELKNTSSVALSGTSSVAVNSGGTLLFSANNQVNQATFPGITVDAGKLDAGGFSQGTGGTPAVPNSGSVGLGALTMNSSSVIDLTSTSVFHFSDSSGAGWTGTLSIWDWTGTPTTGGGAEQILFGGTASGLTAGQLLQVSFYSDGGSTLISNTALILTDGEIIPGPLVVVPEPSTWIGAALALAAVGVTQRKRLRRLIAQRA
jgi:fibronectin-binding autotransporter adhesin